MGRLANWGNRGAIWQSGAPGDFSRRQQIDIKALRVVALQAKRRQVINFYFNNVVIYILLMRSAG